MKKNFSFSKAFLAFAFALLAVSSAFAIPKSICDSCDKCCEDPGPYAFAYPKDMGLSCPKDFYVYADFLWMKASEEGLEYAMENSNSDGEFYPLTGGVVRGFTTRSDDWSWKPGVRINAGFYSNYDAWGFDLAWTWLKIKTDSVSSYNSTSGGLLPLYLVPSADKVADDASGRWEGNFNTFDFMMGKPYHVSRYYVSYPLFGLRAAWIDQDYLIRYSIDSDKPTSTDVVTKNDYWGVGLRGSYKGEFLISSNWSIYAKAAFSLLYGKFDTSQYSSDILNAYKTEDSFYNVQPNAELAFGFSWGKYFNKNKYFASLRVAYEFHHWWDQNQMRKFFNSLYPAANDKVSRGDLSFNGFQFGVGFDF